MLSVSIFLDLGRRKIFEISVASYVAGSVESIPHGPDSRGGFLSRETVRNWSKTSFSDHFLTLSLERFQRLARSKGFAELFRLKNCTRFTVLGFTLKFPYQIRFSWSSMLHESMLYAFLMDQRTKYFFFNYDYSQLIKENSFYPCKTI
jgi:hypothetical protein